MKKRYTKEEKNVLFQQIDALRKEIQSALLETRPIPRHIVDGTLTQVVEYKEACETLGQKYHIKHGPGSTCTGNELIKIMTTLTGYKAKLGLFNG